MRRISVRRHRNSTSSETPCEFDDVGYNFPSVRVMPRTGRRAARRHADLVSAARSLKETRREIAKGLERRRQFHSLGAGPEISLFYNNKFV